MIVGLGENRVNELLHSRLARAHETIGCVQRYLSWLPFKPINAVDRRNFICNFIILVAVRNWIWVIENISWIDNQLSSIIFAQKGQTLNRATDTLFDSCQGASSTDVSIFSLSSAVYFQGSIDVSFKTVLHKSVEACFRKVVTFERRLGQFYPAALTHYRLLDVAKCGKVKYGIRTSVNCYRDSP